MAPAPPHSLPTARARFVSPIPDKGGSVREAHASDRVQAGPAWLKGDFASDTPRRMAPEAVVCASQELA